MRDARLSGRNSCHLCSTHWVVASGSWEGRRAAPAHWRLELIASGQVHPRRQSSCQQQSISFFAARCRLPIGGFFARYFDTDGVSSCPCSWRPSGGPQFVLSDGMIDHQTDHDFCIEKASVLMSPHF